MKELDQRLALADLCGWTVIGGVKSDNCFWVNPKDTSRFYWLPDYVHDLNAMADAEKTLPDWRWALYLHQICCLTVWKNNSNNNESDIRLALLTADAPTRCEAMVRTIGKWKD